MIKCKLEKQRAMLYANKKALAKKWSYSKNKQEYEIN